jgi:hypothetical protein
MKTSKWSKGRIFFLFELVARVGRDELLLGDVGVVKLRI